MLAPMPPTRAARWTTRSGASSENIASTCVDPAQVVVAGGGGGDPGRPTVPQDPQQGGSQEAVAAGDQHVVVGPEVAHETHQPSCGTGWAGCGPGPVRHPTGRCGRDRGRGPPAGPSPDGSVWARLRGVPPPRPRPPRVAVTLTQCWHRVPGGTAGSVLDLVRAVAGLQADGDDGVELVGVGPRGRVPPPPWTPPVPVANLALPLPVLVRLVDRVPPAHRGVRHRPGGPGAPDRAHEPSPQRRAVGRHRARPASRSPAPSGSPAAAPGS